MEWLKTHQLLKGELLRFRVSDLSFYYILVKQENPR